MKSVLLIAAVLLGITANAHIEPGTWVGATIKGEECSMLVGDAFFENNMGHPLNERIRITVGADAFVLANLVKSNIFLNPCSFSPVCDIIVVFIN